MRIALVADYIDSEYAENLINGISSYCREFGIEFLIFSMGELRNYSDKYFRYQYVAITALIKKENLDGIIIAGGTQLHEMSKSDFVSYLKSYKDLPIVNIAVPLPKIPSILVDCDSAFDSMIQHLIDEQGCKKFGFMGVKSNSKEVKNRTEIFKKVLKRNGIPIKADAMWKSDFEYGSAYHILDDYYKRKKVMDFDAIIALNDDMAFACMDFCTKRLHLNVPKDVVITGFDDLQRASFSSPTLTSVNQQVFYQGYKASETLNSMILGEKVPLIQTINAKAILRHSTSRYEDKALSYVANEFISFDNKSRDLYDSKFSVSEWYIKRTQIFNASNMYARMHQNVLIDDISESMTRQLQHFGLQGAAVVIYDNPVEEITVFDYFKPPKKAKVIAGFDYNTRLMITEKKDIVSFNPNEKILPEGLFDFVSNGSILYALYRDTYQYGYIIMRRDNYDMGVYDLLSRAIANQIAVSFEYSKITKEKNDIKDRFQKLDSIAHTDELTGITNRRGFITVGTATLNFANTLGHNGLVIYCDMDGLKKINDSYGHEAGDLAIRTQAQILKKNFRGTDLVARLSGDEFAIVAQGLTIDTYKTILAAVEKDCKEWKKETNSPFGISISMGFVFYPSQKSGYNLDHLMAEADTALYIEKRKKKKKGDACK